MYKSPVTLTESGIKMSSLIDDTMRDLANEVNKNYEDYITFKIEQTLDCEVDKEELIKAMQYDRDQYDKGYQDGYLDGVRDGKQIIFNKLQEFVEGSDTNDNR
jgi:flagellar biosynthesis/type III secretory pathway protein FliH